jgi:thioredoxin 1
MAATYTDTSFDTDVVKSDKLTVIDFWAEWCGPCKTLGPVIEQMSVEYAGKVNIGKMDVGNNSEIPVRYGIQGLPTILFVKGGKVVDKILGAPGKDQLKATIDKHL